MWSGSPSQPRDRTSGHLVSVYICWFRWQSLFCSNAPPDLLARSPEPGECRAACLTWVYSSLLAEFITRDARKERRDADWDVSQGVGSLTDLAFLIFLKIREKNIMLIWTLTFPSGVCVCEPEPLVWNDVEAFLVQSPICASERVSWEPGLKKKIGDQLPLCVFMTIPVCSLLGSFQLHKECALSCCLLRS